MNQLIDLPPELQSLAERQLERGESVRWSGRPRPGRMVWWSLPIFIFAVPWTAFAVFWVYGASGWQFPTLDGPAGLFPLFGLPFVLIGCAMLTSPLWALRKARRTLYLITDRRAVLLERGWGTSVHSYGPESLSHITRKERSDGSGDIIFDQHTCCGESGRHMSPAGFLGIENVKEVEAMLRRLAATGRQREADR